MYFRLDVNKTCVRDISSESPLNMDTRPRLFKSIYWINHYPTDNTVRETNCAIQWIVIYLVYSVIHLLNRLLDAG